MKATTTRKTTGKAARPRLEPITITIRDQGQLRRIHQLAKLKRESPCRAASVALVLGVWKWIEACTAKTGPEVES